MVDKHRTSRVVERLKSQVSAVGCRSEVAGRRHNVPRLKQEVVMELLPLSKRSANQAHGNNVCSPQFRGKLDTEMKIERSSDK